MKPETILQILFECNKKVPQYVMVWNVREHRFEVYLSSKGIA